MTEYKDTLKCFIKRTNSNLEEIRKLATAENVRSVEENDKSAFETTQLINSLLGVVVLPQQRLYCQIPETTYSDLENEGWPSNLLKSSDKLENGKANYDDNLRNLMRYLRNGITHFHIETTEQGGNISGLKIWDESKGIAHWRVRLTLDDLQCVVDKFGEVVKAYHP